MIQLLTDSKMGIAMNMKDPTELIFRMFLTSSRSFKNHYQKQSRVRNFSRSIVSTKLPKFIWVAEISGFKQYKSGNTEALIIVDATGDASTDSLISIYYPGTRYYWKNKELKTENIDYNTVELCQNNLKGSWCNWEEP